MKTFTGFLIILLFSFTNISAQYDGWEDISLPFDEAGYIDQLIFTDMNNGWMLGANQIINSSDGGGVWSLIDKPETENLLLAGLWPVDENICYLTGYISYGQDPDFEKIYVFKTTDRGATWVQQNIPDVYGFTTDIIFSNMQNGVIIGKRTEGYQLIFYTNDGENWSEANFPHENLTAGKIFFLDENIGWIATINYNAAPKLYKTTDGGINWDEFNNPLDEDNTATLHDLCFVNENIGWIAGRYANRQGFIFQTTDGGDNWTNVDVQIPVDSEGNTVGLEQVSIETLYFSPNQISGSYVGVMTAYQMPYGVDEFTVYCNIAYDEDYTLFNPTKFDGYDLNAYRFQETSTKKDTTEDLGWMDFAYGVDSEGGYKPAAKKKTREDFYISFEFGKLKISIHNNANCKVGVSPNGYVTLNGKEIVLPNGDKVPVEAVQQVIVNDNDYDDPGSNTINLKDVNDENFPNLGAYGYSTMVHCGKGNEMVHCGDTKNYVEGREGQDAIYGGNKEDYLDGGDDSDYIEGNDGNDTIMGGNGGDYLHGNEGNDEISGEEGNDDIEGGDGNDNVRGDEGDDIVKGGKGDDEVIGDAGNDKLYGGEGKDKLWGKDGNDTLIDTEDNVEDYLIGGEGKDQIYYSNNDFTTSLLDNDSYHKCGNNKKNLSYLLQKDFSFEISVDSLIDEGGDSDTLDYSQDSVKHFIDIDLTDEEQILDELGNKVFLSGQFENFIGSPQDDVIHVDPLDVPRYIDGGGAKGNDTLYVETMGETPTYDGSTITIPGYEPIYYSGFAEPIFEHVVSVDDDPNDELPDKYELSQSYPNPFGKGTTSGNNSATIAFSLPESGTVTIKVYTILGEEVQTLVNEYKSAGKYSVKFNGSNLGSGIYLYRMETEKFNQTKKMLLIK